MANMIKIRYNMIFTMNQIFYCFEIDVQSGCGYFSHQIEIICLVWSQTWKRIET